MTAVQAPIIDLIDSTPLRGDPAALRERAEDLGYLFFRGLLPRPRVLDVRRRILGVVRDHGWLLDGTDVMAGLADIAAFSAVPAADAAFCGSGVPLAAYQDVQRLREFHALGHSPELLALYRELIGHDVVRLPMSIARVMVPGPGTAPTPAHQDFIHVQGTPLTWTAWFPLGDCPIDLGGLAVLVGSHKDGLLTYHQSTGAGELEAYICDSGLRWATTDFQAGDVLSFTAHTVHRSLPNNPGTQVRLSCDFRYQSDAEPLTENSLKVHCDILDWDELYAAWRTDPQTDELRYYWRKHRLDVHAYDEDLKWQKHKIC